MQVTVTVQQVATLISTACVCSVKRMEPFLMVDHGEGGEWSLIMSDDHMVSKMALFEPYDGMGNGYDWSGVAQVAVQDLGLPLDELDFDPEAGMVCVIGPQPHLERLGTHLAAAYRDDAMLTNLISRATLD